MSERFTLNQQDLRKWAENTWIFLAPALLFFLIQIQAGKSIDDALQAVYIWGLNTVIDLLRKFIAKS
jgi:hypothetical protein